MQHLKTYDSQVQYEARRPKGIQLGVAINNKKKVLIQIIHVIIIHESNNTCNNNTCNMSNIIIHVIIIHVK